MLLCAAQYDIVFGEKNANMQTCERLCAAASARGAGLIVFPELSLTGFTLDTSLSESDNGDTVTFFRRCASEHSLCIVFGYAEKDGEIIRNTLAAVTPDGDIIAKYAKIHPFSPSKENEVFTAGDRLSSFTYNGISFGLTVCYDLRFPELYSALADRCDCVIVSAAWGEARSEHWYTLLKARSVEGQTYTVGCNCICKEGMRCNGGSAVFSPEGRELAHAEGAEALLFADIDAETVQNIRSAFPVRKDRRNDIYRNFYE